MMLKNDTGSSGQNPTIKVDVQQTEAETTIRAYSAITTGNINAVPTIGTPSASVKTVCDAM